MSIKRFEWAICALTAIALANPSITYAIPHHTIYECPDFVADCNKEGFPHVLCDGDGTVTSLIYENGWGDDGQGIDFRADPILISGRNNNFAIMTNFWNSDSWPFAHKTTAGDKPGVTRGDLCIAFSDYGDGSRWGRWLLTLHPDRTPKTVTRVAGTDTYVTSAPGSYPAQFRGCHYDHCTAEGMTRLDYKFSEPYQLEQMYNDMSQLRLNWDMYTRYDAYASYDVAWDIWFNKTNENALQNDGAEIMIWMDHGGYEYGSNPPGARVPNPHITPVGRKRYSQIAVDGLPGKWDVWTGRLFGGDPGASADGPFDIPGENGRKEWNVISLVSVDQTEQEANPSEWSQHHLDFDALQVFRWVNEYTRCPAHAVALGDDQTQANDQCLSSSWYYTSAQAGMEVWHWGTSANENNPASGAGRLSFYTDSFEIVPLWRYEWACENDYLVNANGEYDDCRNYGQHCGWNPDSQWYQCDSY